MNGGFPAVHRFGRHPEDAAHQEVELGRFAAARGMLSDRSTALIRDIGTASPTSCNG